MFRFPYYGYPYNYYKYYNHFNSFNKQIDDSETANNEKKRKYY